MKLVCLAPATQNGVWEANLRIKSVDEEDINKQYLLKVGNDYGEAEFKIKIESDANGSGINKISAN